MVRLDALPNRDIVQQNGSMRQRALQTILLVHAIENTDLSGDALSLEDRREATGAVAAARAPTALDGTAAQLDGDSERFLARRAEVLISRLRVRSPGVDHVLAAAAGAAGLERAVLLLGLLIGFGAAFVDGSRIDLFAYPLIALVVWNLLVYLTLMVRVCGSRPQSGAPGAAVERQTRQVREGFLRRWLTRVYANRVRARIEALITHSIGFNAPLAPGLRRFAADWWELGRPVFRERARRLLHGAAILAAVGLMAGYGVRGWVLRQSAGWKSTVFGPASAHAALVSLYGPASAVSGVSIPSTHALQGLAWTAPTAGGGPAGQWLYLIDWTALLYIVLPRLIAVLVTSISLWRRSASLRTPPSFVGYHRAVLRAPPDTAPSTPARQ
jgi:hypothetical protein